MGWNGLVVFSVPSPLPTKKNTTMKKRFYVYESWREQMELLNVDEKATMLMNLFRFQNNEEIVLDTPMLKMCWASMKFLLEKDQIAYTAAVERGKKAGKSNKKTNDTITAPLQPHITPLRNRVDNDNDNVNDNVNVNDNDDGNGDGNGDGDDSWEMIQTMKLVEMKKAYYEES